MGGPCGKREILPEGIPKALPWKISRLKGGSNEAQGDAPGIAPPHKP